MSKFNQLLNENTIVDFKLLWQLALRYRSHFLVAVMLTCAIFYYNYYSQPVIYAVNVPIKVVTSQKVASDLSSLMPVDTANTVTISELKISFESYSFLKSYAELVVDEPQFDKLNFGAITSNKNLYGSEIKKRCGKNRECLINRLASNLKIFTVEPGATDGRFLLTVSAIENNSAQVLTSLLVKAIDQNRVHVRQYLVIKEIQSVSNLITEGHSILQKMDGYKALEEHEKLKNDIADLKERIRMLQYTISVETANSTALESRWTENKKSTNSLGEQGQDKFEKMKKVNERLAVIKQNISILTNIPEEKRSPSDKLIIAQLTDEQSRLFKTLPSENHRKKLEMSANFIDGQRGKSGEYEFDYLVAKNKLAKLNQDYEAAKIELNELLQQQINNENKVNSMKTDLDFLKNLEAKEMSLKLIKATMTSDLYFEDMSFKAREFRQLTYSRSFIFSFSISAFIYFLSIFIRYLIDDRIYGEEEVRSYLKNLDFVGEVPAFE